ncbi:MAG: 3-oxoadipate enol-lactonase [Streptosporangiales bacterium]|nr:3-oxoadipate enol-lactonase [Streptosporangiales bacterium]
MIAYDVQGPVGAPVVVLGGSLGTTRAMWDEQLPALTRAFRVVRYDHRGHGASPVPPGPYTIAGLTGDVLALLDHLDIPRAHFGGLSLGGMIAMYLAATHPERVDRLALICTSAHLPPARAWLARAATVRNGGTRAVADTVVARWFTPAFAATPRAAELREQLIRSPAEGYAACCEAIATLDLRPLLARIRAYTLVIAGAEDPATPPVHAEVIGTGIPDAHLAVLRDAAHLANVELADRVTAMLVEHWTAPPFVE